MADVNTTGTGNDDVGSNNIHCAIPNSDSMYNLDPHLEVLDKFRKQVSDVLKPHHDDYFLIRWLRARNFDSNKAEEMLRKSMAWRAKYNIDTIRTEWDVPEVMKLYNPGGWFGFDKNGCPMYIQAQGDLDIRGLTMSCRKLDIILYHIWHIEYAYTMFAEQSKKLGHRVDKAVMITDLEGFSMKQLMAPGMDTMLKVMGIVEANYPETLKIAYVINAPRIWGLIFSLVKPFLSDYTRKKIVILGSDWKQKVLQEINADQLPVHWGGTCTDPDGHPKCPSKICPGGEVPKSFYLCEQNLVDPKLLSHLTVGAGSIEVLTYHITLPNHVIKYYFKTESHDISFGVFYKSEGSDQQEEILPVTRRSCHLIPETGVIICDKIGTYTFHFDNKFSWITSKRLHHLIQPMEATEEATNNYSRKISMSMN